MKKIFNEITTSHSANTPRKRGFTLAEILITLGVIGVVSAMTLQSVIKSYQKQVTVNKLKKAYTELNQAIKFSEAEYGDIDNWDWNLNSYDFFDKYFSRYIKIKTTSKNVEGITFYGLNKNIENNYSSLSNPKIIITASGYSLMPRMDNSKKSYTINIDINNINKPNTIGKDVFMFSLIKSKKQILPMAWDDGGYDNPIVDRNVIINGSAYSYSCHRKQRGMWCAALIMMDGWKISDDYPW